MAEPWYEENLPLWQSLEYVSLSDRDALEAAIRKIVTSRYPGPEIDEAILCRDLTAHFYAFAADTPEEYLRRLEGYRRLRTARELYDDDVFHARYQALTAHELPSDVDPQEALRAFWRGRPGAVGRPARLATKVFLQVDYSKPVPAMRGPRSVLASLVAPAYSMYADPALLEEWQHWMGPFSVGFTRLTVPLVAFDDAIGREQPLLMCDVNFVVQDGRGTPSNGGFTFYFLRDDRRWNIVLGGVSNPYELYWPL